MKTAPIEISSEIKQALKEGKAIVALESTIISHGMPYPQNVETALKVEDEVRSHGAIPATIAIINGIPKIGLSSQEIEYLGKRGKDVHKVSRRDIPSIIVNQEDGATTVASTMIFANLAGIKVFATGGIGGVHRNAQETFDISADLQELSQTNIAVVCAGIKSILDLDLTMEYLETFGVPVIGYQTKTLPAFYTIDSDIRLNHSADSSEQIAKILKTKWDLGLNGGVVVANPIPKQFAMEKEVIDKAIEEAYREMEKEKISGKEVTPFLLAKIKDVTAGKSLESNIQLVLNNARLAASIANQYY